MNLSFQQIVGRQIDLTAEEGRSCQPWYAKSGQGYDFMNAAVLFHEPLSVSPGRRLDFHYRVLYRDGWWTAPEFNALAQDFTQPKS